LGVKKLSRNDILRIDGKRVPVAIRLNPRARRLIVKVHPSTGEVAVIAPHERSVSKAIEFLKGEREWIATRLAKVPPMVAMTPGATVPYRGTDYVVRNAPREGKGPVWTDNEAARPTLRVAGRPEHTPRRVEDWLKKQAKSWLKRRVDYYAAELGIQPGKITVRDASSRWGSCSTSGNLSFSWRLIMAPSYVLDYVAAHEVAHLKEMNHGPRFWRLVERLLGDNGDDAQAWLRNHGSSLHRFTAARHAGDLDDLPEAA
jgi:predicted metal-dependent hydrolase